jgi:WD40 repeat protein
VPVFGVGCERGVHYYAMQLIQGVSLAEVFHQLRASQQNDCSSGVVEKRSSGVEQTTDNYSTTPLLHSSSSASTQPIAALSTLKTERPGEFFRTVARLGIQAAEAFSADSQRMAVARGDWINGAVDVWTHDGNTWREVSVAVAEHGQVCTDTAFVPGTDLVASSGYDGAIRLRHWQYPRGHQQLRSHIQAVFSFAVASDGKLIASGADREIRLWDRVTGDLLGTMQVSSWVPSLAFAPDGQTLAWGGGDGSVGFLRTNSMSTK